MNTIIITGASDGLGKAIASVCLKNKWRVVNISRTKSNLEGIENIACDFFVRIYPNIVGFRVRRGRSATNDTEA